MRKKQQRTEMRAEIYLVFMGWSCSGPVKYMNQQQLPKQWLERRHGSWDGACSLRRSFSKFGRVLLPCSRKSYEGRRSRERSSVGGDRRR
jgi:hypothetical protein